MWKGNKTQYSGITCLSGSEFWSECEISFLKSYILMVWFYIHKIETVYLDKQSTDI